MCFNILQCVLIYVTMYGFGICELMHSNLVISVGQVRKVKNVTRDPFGTQHGQIHMQRQNYEKLQLRKVRALKRKSDTKTSSDTEEATSPKTVKSTDVEMTSD